MKVYELIFVLKEENPALVKNILAKHQLVILSAAEIQKIRLAYALKKEAYGFLYSLRFQAPVQAFDNLIAALNLEANILRFMLIEAATPHIEREISKEKEAPTPTPAGFKKETAAPKVRKSFEPVLTNEELEKKIEEILQ